MSEYALVTRAYPSEYRHAHVEELVATANELSGVRWSRVQSWSLLAGGLKTRARLATGSDPRRVWAVGIRWALFLTIGSIALSAAARWSHGTVGITPGPSLLTLAPTLAAVLALWRTSRWPSAVAVSIVGVLRLGGWLIAQPSGIGTGFRAAIWVSVALQVAAAWYLASQSSRQSEPLARTPLLAVGLIVTLLLVDSTGGTGFLWSLLSIAVPVAAVLLAPFDPRLIVVTTVMWVGSAPLLTYGAWAQDATGPELWFPRLLVPTLLLAAFTVATGSIRRLIRI